MADVFPPKCGVCDLEANESLSTMQADYDDLMEEKAYTEYRSNAGRLERAIEASFQATKRWEFEQSEIAAGWLVDRLDLPPRKPAHGD